MATLREVMNILLSLTDANLKANQIKSMERSSKIYHRVLRDIPIEILDAAVLFYISEGTFFPAAGELRKKAIALQMLALEIPTPGEAWAQVQKGLRSRSTILCDEGVRLKDIAQSGITGSPFAKAMHAYDDHWKLCEICTQGGFEEHYDHPAVTEAVRRLGGRDKLFTRTDTGAADRARFMDSYKRVIEKEKTLAGMPQEVRLFVEDRKVALERNERAALDRGDGDGLALIQGLADGWGGAFER